MSALRYDKRGVGRSGGDHFRTGMAQQLADARGGLGWLAARAGGVPLLAIGHSEGSYYAAELATAGAVGGAVLVSGSARPGGEVLSWQTRELAARLPASARLILRLMRTRSPGPGRSRAVAVQPGIGDDRPPTLCAVDDAQLSPAA